MKKAFILAVFVPALLLSTTEASAAVKKAKIVVKKTNTTYASSSDQILSYLLTRPFYSTSTKDKIIQSVSTSTMMDVSRGGLYAVNQIRNNQIEEQGNYWDGQCENEMSLYLGHLNLKASYTSDKQGNIKTTISGPNNEFNVTLDRGWFKEDLFSMSTSSTASQRRDATKGFYNDTPDGYSWSIGISAKTYSPKCAKWMFDREVFTNRSIGGYQYGFDTFYPQGTVFYNVRGEKNIKGNQVEFLYSSSPFSFSTITTHTKSIYEGTDGRTVPRTQDYYYVFRKGNILYNVSISTDKPYSHIDADKIITSFFVN